jgi:hypothetical protein
MLGKNSQTIAYIVLLGLIITVGFGAWFGAGAVDLSGLENF